VTLLIFPSTHWLLKAEKALITEKLRYRIVALPEDSSSDCLMGVEISGEVLDRCRDLLVGKEIPYRADVFGKNA
jgi:hypothetical protein